jgi:REP element-mobilizing transposase RayT
MQLKLFAARSFHDELARVQHGGDVRRVRRKMERPVSTRRAMHVTPHSDRAYGDWSLRRHQREVRETLAACARRSGVRVYDFANVGSHLHLLVRVRRRAELQSILRSFAGLVARRVTGAGRNKPLRGGRFWSALAWSRIVSWGREYSMVRNYIYRNRIEGEHGTAARLAVEQRSRRRKTTERDRAP